VHGSGYSANETYSGDIDWCDYTLQVRLTPLVGQTHLAAVRVQGALRSYAFGLAAGGKLALYKNAKGYQVLAETPFDWQTGQAYLLRISCQGKRLQAAVDGQVVFDWEDEQVAYLHGQIGLVNFSGCHTRFEEVRVTP
jgi:hypothetical protein